MKAFATILILFALACSGFSQSVQYYSVTPTDTLVGADSAGYAAPKMNIPYGYSVQWLQTKLTGSSSVDSAWIRTSLDGVNYCRTTTLFSQLSNASGSKTAAVSTGICSPYIKLYVKQGGTVETNKENVYWMLYPKTKTYGSGPPIYTLTSTTGRGATPVSFSNTVTRSYVYPGALMGSYAYSVQCINAVTSGAGTSTYTLETSNDGTNWTTLQTKAFVTLAGNIVWESTAGDLGRYVRVTNTHSGTGVDTSIIYIKLYPIYY